MPCAVLSTGNAASSRTKSPDSCPSRGRNRSGGKQNLCRLVLSRGGGVGGRGCIKGGLGARGVFRFLKVAPAVLHRPVRLGVGVRAYSSLGNLRSSDLPPYHRSPSPFGEISFGEYT